MPKTQPVLTILYDGDCPLCSREIVWMASRNYHQQLAFQNIHQAGFDASALGVTTQQLMQEIHAITAEPRLIKGIEVFAIAYSSLGLGGLAALLRWRWTRPLFERLYACFARHRLAVTSALFRRECRNGQCHGKGA